MWFVVAAPEVAAAGTDALKPLVVFGLGLAVSHWLARNLPFVFICFPQRSTRDEEVLALLLIIYLVGH